MQLMENGMSPGFAPRGISCIQLLFEVKVLWVNKVLSVPSAVHRGIREGYFLVGVPFIFVKPLSHMLCNCLSGLPPPFPVYTSVEVLAHCDLLLMNILSDF